LAVRRYNHARLDLIHLLTAIKLIAGVSGTGDQQCQQYQIAHIFKLSLQFKKDIYMRILLPDKYKQNMKKAVAVWRYFLSILKGV
jgi:hypothetical protein